MLQGPLEQVYKAALSLGVANQLTNILRDVGEDSNERDRWAGVHDLAAPHLLGTSHTACSSDTCRLLESSVYLRGCLPQGLGIEGRSGHQASLFQQSACLSMTGTCPSLR